MLDALAQAIYILCALTSLACAGLLLRGYFRTRSRLLLWSGICFLCLAGDNAVLFLDLIVFRDLDLSIFRDGLAVTGLSLLVFGMVWDAS